MKIFKKYSGIVVLLLTIVAGFVLAVPVHAAPCQYISTSEYHWGVGRITSLNINIGNNNGCPDGWGTIKGSVLFDDIPADITFWGYDGTSVNVPSVVEGLTDIKVVGSDDIIYGTSQLLISLKVDSYPIDITLGDPIEITGEGFNNSDNTNKVVNLSVGGYNSSLPIISWANNRIVVSTSAFGYFKVGSNTFKVFVGSDSPSNGFQSKTFDINIKAPACTINSWQCSDWDSCSLDGIQKRTCEKMGWGNNAGINYCEGGVPSPATTQACTPPCAVDSWSCGNWSGCSQGGTQTRTCDKISNCQGGVASPATSQSCTYVAPVPSCTSFNYSSWSECASDGKQTRNIISKNPYNCEGGESPKITQSCAYIPPCTTDTWSCDAWNACSLSGIQNRSCRKVFDCLDVQTAPPTTDQYCEAPNRPAQQVPQDSSDVISNQEVIIKSTVKLLCPVDTQKASQGSGTIIDSSGTILTNKHVVAGTLGCLIGFISDFNDEPYFGERHIADILKVSPDQDIAILKIRNPQNKTLPNIDIARGSNNLRLGAKITTYGFPAKFGTKVTYTSGDFSGTDGTYIKTTAILEYGNSGGGAYLKDGTFIGIPSAVVRGELNALGYILSINTINAWLGNSSITYGSTNNNNYSRVSVLEDIDLNKLGALKLFIPDTDTKGNFIAPATNQSVQKTTEQPKNNQRYKESTIIESVETSPKIKQEQNNLVSPKNEFIEKQGKENKKENGNNADTEVLEQRRSLFEETVQEIVKIADSNIEIGQQVKVIAQTQVQNQEKLEISMKKIQSRSGLAKFFVGSDYGEIKSSQELLEQNKKQIKNLKQIGIQLSKKDDQHKIAEQIKLLEQANQQMETSLNEAKKGFSLFGWAFRKFAK